MELTVCSYMVGVSELTKLFVPIQVCLIKHFLLVLCNLLLISSPTTTDQSPTMTVDNTNFNMSVNPVYQVDCQIDAKGKYFPGTKRRIRWKFGFSDPGSLQKGLTGTQCRGQEHEVVLVWSLTSGKQLVLADGCQVHFASGRLSEKFECSWPMKGGHELKAIAYAAPPLFPTPGFRQFDLLLDGLSYWDMPKIFQLGKQTPSRARSSPVASGLSQQENAHFAYRPQRDFHASPPNGRMPAPSIEAAPVYRAIEAAPIQRSQSVPKALMIETIDLLSEPTTPPSTKGASQNFFAGSVGSPTGVMDEFAPVQPQMKQFTYKDTHNQIMGSYQTSSYQTDSSSLTVYQAQPAMVPPTSYYGAQQSYTPSYDSVEVSYGQSPVVQPSPRTSVAPSMMQPLEIRDLDEDRDDMSPMEKAMRSLVNFEDISKPIEAPQDRKSREVRETAKPNKSKPQPPRQELYLRMDAPIGEIQAHASTKTTPTKQVMRVHAFDPAAQHAGMMVPYGSPQPQNYAQQQQYHQQAVY
jgi:hypothetical protein